MSIETLVAQVPLILLLWMEAGPSLLLMLKLYDQRGIIMSPLFVHLCRKSSAFNSLVLTLRHGALAGKIIVINYLHMWNK